MHMHDLHIPTGMKFLQGAIRCEGVRERICPGLLGLPDEHVGVPDGLPGSGIGVGHLDLVNVDSLKSFQRY